MVFRFSPLLFCFLCSARIRRLVFCMAESFPLFPVHFQYTPVHLFLFHQSPFYLILSLLSMNTILREKWGKNGSLRDIACVNVLKSTAFPLWFVGELYLKVTHMIKVMSFEQDKFSLSRGQPEWFTCLVNVHLQGSLSFPSITCGNSKRWTFLPTYHTWKLRHLSAGHWLTTQTKLCCFQPEYPLTCRSGAQRV